MTEIPEFKTLDEEVEFWESHDSANYWEDMEEVTFEVDLHKNLLHPKLVVVTQRPEHCSRCREALEDILIEYVVWNNDNLLVIRDVPALRCQVNGHEYILEETLDEIERLLDLEKTHRVQPAEIIQVPVFSLKVTA
jgi:hypothetical protein